MKSDEVPFPKAREISHREIRSRLEERGTVINEILDRLRTSGFQPDPYIDRLCLDEAITNAIVHGNREDPSKKVLVTLYCSEHRWGVEISDEGAGFDWGALKEQLGRGLDPARPSKRGIALILASGADVDFLDGGRRMVMVRSSKEGDSKF